MTLASKNVKIVVVGQQVKKTLSKSQKTHKLRYLTIRSAKKRYRESTCSRTILFSLKKQLSYTEKLSGFELSQEIPSNNFGKTLRLIVKEWS